MIDVVTVTLIILGVALLRRSLLTVPDVAPGVRVDGEEFGIMAPVPVFSRAQTPILLRKKRTR
ncbi:hypothetical protein [Pseudodesulfovibrio sediminis]|uniref:hypothetical protein n=1 Tax=Pseudodesulfovibrio sediminis TaxID=2810563 RepID=UPI001E4F0F0C|nr:hypothetical protein [Pseudodesulfovibrio sediminis]